MDINVAGKGTPLTATDVQAAVAALGCDAASLWALVAVETAGFGFLPDRRPDILFERHVFAQRTGGRFSQEHPDLSNPVAGGYSGGAAEYGRLSRAADLDLKAALESTSWGLGQVMGFNAAKVGFTDVFAMIATIGNAEASHLQATVNYITANPALLAAFQTHDWPSVAFYYNGENYQAHHYDTNLQNHFEIFSDVARQPDINVRIAQACLLYLNFFPAGARAGVVDGIMGPTTRSALMAFQRARALALTGAADATTMTDLTAVAAI